MTNNQWTDEYWLLLMQLYQRKPTGIKPLYSRDNVSLAIELHIPPADLYARMFKLRNAGTPHLKRLWNIYGDNPKKLNRKAAQLRQMQAFCTGGAFYDGVSTVTSFEQMFTPLPHNTNLCPVALVIILDLYFRLTPATMQADTPEVKALAKTLRVKPRLVAEVMRVMQTCDPWLSRRPQPGNPLTPHCRSVWQQYGNDNPEQLAAIAAQLTAYYK